MSVTNEAAQLILKSRLDACLENIARSPVKAARFCYRQLITLVEFSQQLGIIDGCTAFNYFKTLNDAREKRGFTAY